MYTDIWLGHPVRMRLHCKETCEHHPRRHAYEVTTSSLAMEMEAVMHGLLWVALTPSKRQPYQTCDHSHRLDELATKGKRGKRTSGWHVTM